MMVPIDWPMIDLTLVLRVKASLGDSASVFGSQKEG